MSATKEWDWSKNTDSIWLVPSMDSAYLAENWSAKGFSSVLDLGCGLGRHSIYLAKHGFDVSAVDLSDYGVAHLRQWAERENVTVRAQVCNMLALPFADGSFDCAMAYNVIYHTDTKGLIAVLGEIGRVLRPGGELYLTLISKNTWSYQHTEESRRIDANTLLLDEIDTERNVPHCFVDITDIKQLFADWGFEQPPTEKCVYNLDSPEVFSNHWVLIVKKMQK